MNGSRMRMNRSPVRMNSSRVSMNRFPSWSKILAETVRERVSSAIAWQVGATRLCRPAIDNGHLYRCFRFAVFWRDDQADGLPVGTATGCGFAVAGGNSEARRPAEPTCRSVGYGGCFANTTFGSTRAARRGSRPDSSRADTVAPNDGA